MQSNGKQRPPFALYMLPTAANVQAGNMDSTVLLYCSALNCGVLHSTVLHDTESVAEGINSSNAVHATAACTAFECTQY